MKNKEEFLNIVVYYFFWLTELTEFVELEP